MTTALLLLVLADAGDIACPPADRPVADHANLLDAQAEERIARTCAALQRDKSVPLAVVTIRSMREHGEAGPIESFALRLLAAWQYDAVEADGRRWEKGILLLVSQGDRKCRIELGSGWGTSRNAECSTILDTWILPEFRSGGFERGIEVGVGALDSMARGNAVHAPRKQAVSYAWVIGLVLLVLSVISFARRGTRGVAWPIWRGGFSALGWILLILASSRGRRRRGSWGGYSGGFGGGFGGGGGGFSRGGGRGATGSW